MKDRTIAMVAILSAYGCSLVAISLVYFADCVCPSYPAEACMNLMLSLLAALLAFNVALFPFQAKVLGGRTAKLARKLRLGTVKTSVPASLILEAAGMYGALKVTAPAGLTGAELLMLRAMGIAACIAGVAVGVLAVTGAWACCKPENMD